MLAEAAPAEGSELRDRAAEVSRLDGRVFAPGEARAAELSRTLSQDVQMRTQAANLRENHAWEQVKTRADWEQFRDVRIQALCESLGRPADVAKELRVR